MTGLLGASGPSPLSMIFGALRKRGDKEAPGFSDTVTKPGQKKLAKKSSSRRRRVRSSMNEEVYPYG